jgi:DUF1680 family protein
MALRIPAWSGTAGLTVNGDQESPERMPAPPGHYIRLRRTWQPGDVVRLRLDTTPRWTYPDPRVDAVRGCAAIERGPLVYCLEQTDQAAPLDELTAVAGAPLAERPVTLPGIGATIAVTTPGRHVPPSGPDGRAPAGPGERAVTVTAVPYFQWDNRGPGAMRVWIPAAGQA